MSQGEEYILGTSLTEQKRLLKQKTLFEAEACWLLDRVGLQAGGRAIAALGMPGARFTLFHLCFF